MLEDQRVESDVATHTTPVQSAHRFGQLLQREAYLGPRRKMLEPEVDRVRTRLDGSMQLRPVAGRAHDFRFRQRSTSGQISSLAVLSPRWSCGTPSLSIRASIRFDIGVCGANFR